METSIGSSEGFISALGFVYIIRIGTHPRSGSASCQSQ